MRDLRILRAHRLDACARGGDGGLGWRACSTIHNREMSSRGVDSPGTPPTQRYFTGVLAEGVSGEPLWYDVHSGD